MLTSGCWQLSRITFWIASKSVTVHRYGEIVVKRQLGWAALECNENLDIFAENSRPLLIQHCRASLHHQVRSFIS